MRAALAQREPDMLADWESRDLYGELRKASEGRPAFLLPDGPPYANGDIHLGHCVNKLLKDIVIRSRTLDGFDAPYIPGWDCHGLPIELVVEREHGRVGEKLDPQEFREACRRFARAQVDGQRRDFRRLGVLGDWERPYLTMDPAYEAEQLRAFGRIISNGHVYKGFKPVHWCLDCGSALAEAEVEYADKKSPAIDTRFRVVDGEALLDAFGGDARSNVEGPVSIPIWTTTPWTLPANQAVALHPGAGIRAHQLRRVRGARNVSSRAICWRRRRDAGVSSISRNLRSAAARPSRDSRLSDPYLARGAR
jgi:isoleucyl-tRNA synthetase